MFKFKFVLPMLAFVLAIGMSFAVNRSNASVAGDEVIIYQGEPVDVNAGCQEGPFDCRIQLTDNNNDPIPGEVYQVYGPDLQGNPTIELKSISADPIKVRLSTLGN